MKTADKLRIAGIRKKELLTSLMILGFAIIILTGGIFAIRNINERQQEQLTGSFIYDNGCYGIYNAGRLSCISSNIGKRCINGCYSAKTMTGVSCECLPD